MRKYLVRVSTYSLQAKTRKKAENVCKTKLKLEQTGTGTGTHEKQHVEKETYYKMPNCKTAGALAQLAGSPALRALLRKSRGKSLASIGHLCTVVPQCPSRPKFF